MSFEVFQDDASCAYDDRNYGSLHSAQLFHFHFQFGVFLQLLPGLLLEVVIGWDTNIYDEGGLLLLIIDREVRPIAAYTAVCNYRHVPQYLGGGVLHNRLWLVFIPLLWDFQAGML